VKTPSGFDSSPLSITANPCAIWQTCSLENGRFEAHIPGMVTIVQCSCGAEYRRTEEKFLVPHTGDAVCTVCGAALESWSENSHVPSYELIERPARKPER
jgi:hypothetical protein